MQTPQDIPDTPTDTISQPEDTPVPIDTPTTDVGLQDVPESHDIWDDTLVPDPPDASPNPPEIVADVSPESDSLMAPELPMDSSDNGPAADSEPLDPATEPLFRIDQLTWAAPDLCYVPTDNPNAPCVPLTNLVNALIEGMINDEQDPTDVLFQFHGAIDVAGAIDVTLGEGICERNDVGEIVHCQWQDKPEKPAVTFQNVPITTYGTCTDTVDIPSPCFKTPKKNGVVLSVADVSIGLKHAFAAGQFQSKNPQAFIESGHLQGFMPKTLAQTIQFNLPTGEPLTLAQLLSQVTTVEVDGHPGWTLEFKFNASQNSTL